MTASPMGAGWYEELRQEASLRLEPNVFDWLVGGSEREESLHSAHDAWSEARLLPDAGFDVTEVDLSTSVLGRRVEPLSPWYRPGSTASCTPRRNPRRRPHAPASGSSSRSPPVPRAPWTGLPSRTRRGGSSRTS